MPSLNWIGKEAVANHDKEVPFRLLRKVKSASEGDKSENLIIHGDNLEALKALMPYYQGKIKCIYIDPPYNTGNESWIYNDNVKSPKIKKWLGKVVGGESEDLCRHDKWLCMMYPRLRLLKELLSQDGVIFVSIDDNEIENLKQLMEEIFEGNFYAMLTWKKKTKPGNMGEARFKIQQNIEYVLVYGNIEMVKHPRFRLNQLEQKEYPHSDKEGKYRIEEIAQRRNIGTLKRDTMLYPLMGINPKEGYRWQLSPDRYEELMGKKRIQMLRGRPVLKVYDFEEDNFAYVPFWSHLEGVGTAEDGKKELAELLGINHGFETVKPLELIKRLIFHSTNPDDIILDSFAGSGTTGHAVLDLNKEENAKRKFILVEMMDYAKNITAERVKKAIEKYKYEDDFEYCELDKPLFNEEGQIEEECTFEQLATYIYFTETKTNIDKAKIERPFIGESQDGSQEFYLIFKEKGKNKLSRENLKKIGKSAKKKVVYADQCLLSHDELQKNKIQFKQIPYEVERY